ncbi:olfactory receptor 1086-like [Nannospalax galili]|uniref:olfactory receptor 1086-like n=1 Tax=Nannospalax galili TaxID=1026970 RepID=UPI00081A2689|nr:olfactory receptor 1086-like [Nannospalax galili]
MENITEVTEFVLKGFTDNPDLKILFFFLFLVIYLFTLLGNLGLIVLVIGDSRLHNPMYYFLSALSSANACYSSVITPQMLVDFMSTEKTISFLGCTAQMFLAITSGTTECFLLAATTCDCYVAIHSQLLYAVSMSPRVYTPLITSYAGRVLHAIIHTVATFSLSFHGSNEISHIFCDIPPLGNFLFGHPHKQLLLHFCAGFVEIVTILIVLISYGFILCAILSIRSAEGKWKVFSTCGSHLTGVFISHAMVLFMYVRPSSIYALEHAMIVSIFYSIVIPKLNPLINSLRNKDVKQAMKSVWKSTDL